MERDESPKGDAVPESIRQARSEDARSDLGELSGRGLSLTGARFARLSSEVMECLSELSLNLQSSLEELRKVEAEIEIRKSELKRLRELEVSAAELERLMEEQRLRVEGFEAVMQDQRRLWDEEKARREREEREYWENLRIQRQREEEEYRRQRALEEQRERQRIDEELRALQLENRMKMESLEKALLQKELSLKERELEWVQLAQELERLMSRLAGRSRRPTPPSVPDPVSRGSQQDGAGESRPS